MWNVTWYLTSTHNREYRELSPLLGALVSLPFFLSSRPAIPQIELWMDEVVSLDVEAQLLYNQIHAKPECFIER